MKHKVIIIGHGTISRKYLAAIGNLDDMAVVSVLGRNAEKVKLYAEKNGIPYHGTNLEELVNISKPSIALICTPNATHYQNVLDAASCGLHVLCEKPLHIDPEKQNEMLEYCKNNDVKLGVCFGRRFIRHIRYVKDFIDSGKLGKILVIDAFIKLWRDSKYYTESSWHGCPEIDGGGPFIQQGAHIIDLALWFGGGYQNVISSDLFTLHHPVAVEDHGYAVIKYRNDAVGFIEASTVCKGQNDNRIEISGTNGSIHVNFTEICHWQVDGCKKPDFSSEENIFYEQLKDFKNSIDNNEAPFVNGESAKLATELIAELYSKAKVCKGNLPVKN